MEGFVGSMKTAEIRERFLEYFERHDHTRVSSSSLVPENDPSLLFTNAGMVQFKDTFLGLEKRDYTRATSSQRCVRAGGKHNDLENVGYTARHHTFFEMLGNFSFGDYFKAEAIRMAWEFLTGDLGIPEEKLWVTVFEDDDEAADVWLNDIGVDPSRFSRMGAHANFWSMGDTGPCGPCSEIYYDHGPDVAGGPPGTPEEDGDRYTEIWNLVFMQYKRFSDGNMELLPSPSVDTGMGLERVAAVMQGVHNNYDIDLFSSLIDAASDVLGVADRSNHSLRVVADHIRSCAFLITDGVLPSNEGRGYVLRRIIRRAVRHGYSLGGETPFFYKLIQPLVDEMGEAFPELAEASSRVEDALKAEEIQFAETLEQGLKILEQKTANLDGDEIPGDLAFLLYDTYGFPVDLTADVARERNMTVDMAGFEKAMEGQRERARSSSRFETADIPILNVDQESEFTGYQSLEGRANVLALGKGDKQVDRVEAGDEVVVVLDKTPFYAESGGQVGDSGQLNSANAVVDISDTQRMQNGVVLHFGVMRDGQLSVDDEVKAEVNDVSRAATAANHSATHLLHAALQGVLGSHVEQKGSLVNADKLRFDFSHSGPMTAEEIHRVEDIVNREVMLNNEVETRVMPLADAQAAGAAALFGEKYGDEVRVVGMADFSLELCGGTHVQRTGDIGVFRISSESGIAAGIRRLEAVTHLGAQAYLRTREKHLLAAAALLKASPEQLESRIRQLQEKVRKLEDEKSRLQSSLAGGSSASNLDSRVIEVGDVSLLTARMDGLDTGVLRETIDKYKDKLGKAVVVLAAEVDGKARIFAGVSKEISGQYPAGALIKHLTELGGGRGGGRPDMAEGGVPDPASLEDCLAAVEGWLTAQNNE
jgi:alanyl-tRNA synthetase